MDKILISAANDDQIRAFAEVVCGIDAEKIGEANTRAKLLAVLGAVWTQEHITVPTAPTAMQDGQTMPAVPLPDVTHLPHMTEEFGPITMFKIISTNMPGGNIPAHPCVNGRQLVMQRNMLIAAPYAFYLALRNANTGDPYEVENGPGKPPTIMFTDVTNYPLTDVTLPSKAAIDEWHARVGPKLLAA